MTEQRDPLLQTLFTESQRELDGDRFTLAVMARTRTPKLQIAAWGVGLTALTLAVGWLFSLPLMAFALLFTEVLNVELFVIANANLAWLLAPINNVGAAVIIGYKAIRTVVNKARAATYVN